MSEEEGRKGERAKCLKPINKNKVDNNDGKLTKWDQSMHLITKWDQFQKSRILIGP